MKRRTFPDWQITNQFMQVCANIMRAPADKFVQLYDYDSEQNDVVLIFEPFG